MALHLIAALALGANTLSLPAPNSEPTVGPTVALSAAHRAIPAWGRKYNVNCNHCHYPAVPRLNAKGYAFKWAGYRMPEEIGENQEVKQVSEYLAARFDFRYVWRKTESKAATTSSFELDNATLFAGGSVGTNYGAFFEFEHVADEPVELVNNFYGVWGKEKSYGGARVGLMHWLLRGAVAGFDRPTAINTVTVLANPLTKGGVPFKFSADQLGAEAFYVMNKNRLSFELLNGISPEGIEGHSPNTKDFAAIDQWIYDVNGSGLTAVAYFGAIAGLDTTITATSHYNRYAISANKFYKRLEVLGGYAYAKDNDLPVGTVFNSSSVTGSGFWGYTGYTFPSSFTAFGRYEHLNSNKDVANSGNVRYVLGGVIPVNLPEYLRLAAEYTLDKPRPTNSLKKYGFTLQALLNF
jgi:hypothetical protein